MAASASLTVPNVVADTNSAVRRRRLIGVLLIARVLRHPCHGEWVQHLQHEGAEPADQHRRQVAVHETGHRVRVEVGGRGIEGDGTGLSGDPDGAADIAGHVPARRLGQASDEAQRCARDGAAERHRPVEG